MITRRFEYATATIVLLVILRLAIGWHFFKEGVSHHADPAWSSEGFLRQAKGPLGDMYHSMLPNLHGWDRLMLAPLAEGRAAEKSDADPALKKEVDLPVKPESGESPVRPELKKSPANAAANDTPKQRAAAADTRQLGEVEVPVPNSDDKQPAAKKSGAESAPIYEAWLKAATADWKADAEKYAEFYHFDDKQKAEAAALVDDAHQRMKEQLEDYEADIRLYRELVARDKAMQTAPGADTIPNEVARNAAAQQNPLGERGLNGQSAPITTMPAAWQASAKAVDQLFHDQLRGLLTDDQREMAVPPSDATRLHKIDTAIAWGLMIVGGLLIVGLFTRVAAVVGALFLLSIICAQPPWLATSVQTYTYNQTVEMLALLALATTPVGRWGGLDYFLGLCCRGCCGGRSRTVVDPAAKSSLPPGVTMPPALKKKLT